MRHLIALFYDIRYAVLRHLMPETAEELRHRQWWREAFGKDGGQDLCEKHGHDWIALLDGGAFCPHCGIDQASAEAAADAVLRELDEAVAAHEAMVAACQHVWREIDAHVAVLDGQEYCVLCETQRLNPNSTDLIDLDAGEPDASQGVDGEKPDNCWCAVACPGPSCEHPLNSTERPLPF